MRDAPMTLSTGRHSGPRVPCREFRVGTFVPMVEVDLPATIHSNAPFAKLREEWKMSIHTVLATLDALRVIPPRRDEMRAFGHSRRSSAGIAMRLRLCIDTLSSRR